mmetsp:Transcript_84552/g.225959  ORF Transcript_84552/g.225959 Transcript_84552/m.225959 type:complete len:528 (-) Transcript_84552:131-1714(-)
MWQSIRGLAFSAAVLTVLPIVVVSEVKITFGDDPPPEGVVQIEDDTLLDFLGKKPHAFLYFHGYSCDTCKKVTTHFEKAAEVRPDVAFGSVNVGQSKRTVQRYNVDENQLPFLVWLESGAQTEYSGPMSTHGFVEWIEHMTAPAVHELDDDDPDPEPQAMHKGKPVVTYYGPSLPEDFKRLAGTLRREAWWYYKKGVQDKVTVHHMGERPQVLASGFSEYKMRNFFRDNEFPMFGALDADNFDRVMNRDIGLIWYLFDIETSEELEYEADRHREMMTRIARKLHKKYQVVYMDTVKYGGKLQALLGVDEVPTVVVQPTSKNRQRFIYAGETGEGDYTEEGIMQFVKDVEAGKVEVHIQSEPEPSPEENKGPVRIVVGHTLMKECIRKDKDVFLFIYASWCGHCKAMMPEWEALAKKVKAAGLSDMLVIAKMDGNSNESPVQFLEWKSFPTLYYFKAGGFAPDIYSEREREVKNLWRFISSRHSKKEQFNERIEGTPHSLEETDKGPQDDDDDDDDDALADLDDDEEL